MWGAVARVIAVISSSPISGFSSRRSLSTDFHSAQTVNETAVEGQPVEDDRRALGARVAYRLRHQPCRERRNETSSRSSRLILITRPLTKFSRRKMPWWVSHRPPIVTKEVT